MALLKQTGRTRDGRAVIGGIYGLYETHGIALDAILDALNAQRAIPDWLDFWDAAVRAGVKPKRLRTLIELTCADVFGAEHTHQVIRRLDHLRPQEP